MSDIRDDYYSVDSTRTYKDFPSDFSAALAVRFMQAIDEVRDVPHKFKYTDLMKTVDKDTFQFTVVEYVD